MNPACWASGEGGQPQPDSAEGEHVGESYRESRLNARGESVRNLLWSSRNSQFESCLSASAQK